MVKISKLKFSEYMQNISRSKSFGKFVLIVQSQPRGANYAHQIILAPLDFQTF